MDCTHVRPGVSIMPKFTGKRRKYQRLSQKNPEREALLIKVAQQYCERKSMADIGTDLGIKRQTVVRLIKQAKEREYIRDLRPIFSPPRAFTLANDLRSRYNLKDVLVVKSSDNFALTRAAIASTAAEYLKDIVLPTLKGRTIRIGIAGGETMNQLVEKTPPIKALFKDQDIQVFPLNILESTSHEQSASRLAFKLESKLSDNSVAIRIYMRPAQPFKSLTLWRQEAALVRSLKTFEDCNHDWEQMNVALVGITLAEKQSEIGQQLAAAGATEELYSRALVLNEVLLNKNFEIIDDLFLGCQPSTLKYIAEDVKNRFSILVAGGRTRHGNESKAECIDLALRQQIANVLITDDRTADEIKRLHGSD